MAVKFFEFNSVVRGYHYFQKCWEPEANQELDRAHEADNPYDYFAIKACTRGSNGLTVGHLPMEISCPIKYILQRGTKVVATLSSTNYKRSPLVQGDLEIPCSVTIFMPETLKNEEIIKMYKDMVDVLYTEPDGNVVLSSFVHHSIDIPLKLQTKKRKQKSVERLPTAKEIEDTQIKDIRSFFSRTIQQKKNKLVSKEPGVIKID